MNNVIKVILAAAVSLVLGLPASSAGWAQAQPAASKAEAAKSEASPQQPPLTAKEVVQLVKKNKKNLQAIAPEISSRGVDFEMTTDISEKLRKAGATPDFIESVKNQGPSERAAMAASRANQGSVPPEEAQAFQGIQNELDPDRKIQFVNDFATKYPKSTLLTYAYFLAEGAEFQKKDLAGCIQYGEKSLALDPNNFSSLRMMTYVLSLPQTLQNDPNPDAKLNEAEKDGQNALAIINSPSLRKVAGETDDAFLKRKNEYLASIDSSLAMVHFQQAMGGLAGMDKQELGKAETEYKQAIAVTTDPNPEDYFRLGEVLSYENKVDDALAAFTKASELSTDNPGLKQLADQHIAQLKSAKK